MLEKLFPIPKLYLFLDLEQMCVPTIINSKQVDWYVSRDLDSRFNLREFAAVQDWFQSGKAFHTMRDHPNHGVPMLGSAWGTRLTDPTVRLGWLKTWKKGITSSIVWAKRNDYGPDQTFLKRYTNKIHSSKNYNQVVVRTYPKSEWVFGHILALLQMTSSYMAKIQHKILIS